MGITAVILTHDSAGTLGKTLRSVAFCDEVLVIDDHSTDATCALAKKMGATVIVRSLDGNFAAQRNFGLSKAKQAWVLYVDSDEVVPEPLAKEIREAVLKVDANGFYLKRQDMMWGRALRFGETQHVRLLRLAKKGVGGWVRPVHEVWNITGPVGTLIHPLQHTPHPDVAHFLADINAYSTINAMHLYKTGVRASWWHMAAYPAAKFIQNYVFRRGFMDGMPGVIVAVMMSFHSFLTRGKLWHYLQTHG